MSSIIPTCTLILLDLDSDLAAGAVSALDLSRDFRQTVDDIVIGRKRAATQT
jgi:hypothetical protein